jgi:hypothetical protein
MSAAVLWSKPICKPHMLNDKPKGPSYYAQQYEAKYGASTFTPIDRANDGFVESVLTSKCKPAEASPSVLHSNSIAALSGSVYVLTQMVDARDTQIKQLKRDLQLIESKWNKLKQVKTQSPACAICLENKVNRIFQCAHACCCDKCGVKITQCPVCRQNIMESRVVYFA